MACFNRGGRTFQLRHHRCTRKVLGHCLIGSHCYHISYKRRIVDRHSPGHISQRLAGQQKISQVLLTFLLGYARPHRPWLCAILQAVKIYMRPPSFRWQNAMRCPWCHAFWCHAFCAIVCRIVHNCCRHRRDCTIVNCSIVYNCAIVNCRIVNNCSRHRVNCTIVNCSIVNQSTIVDSTIDNHCILCKRCLRTLPLVLTSCPMHAVAGCPMQHVVSVSCFQLQPLAARLLKCRPYPAALPVVSLVPSFPFCRCHGVFLFFSPLF
mmetsp:Transcript_130917/g.230735  ORF Transcript_130917/g.230735 Transcript_130917/m.230735 type:complete len:264 (-) Transcript_130917:949-1740(-)